MDKTGSYVTQVSYQQHILAVLLQFHCSNNAL